MKNFGCGSHKGSCEQAHCGNAGRYSRARTRAARQFATLAITAWAVAVAWLLGFALLPAGQAAQYAAGLGLAGVVVLAGFRQQRVMQRPEPEA